MIFISGYASDLYDSMLTQELGWQKKIIETTTKDSSGKSHQRIEILWTNKYFESALKTGEVPITLTEKEQKQGKLNPLRP